MVLYSVLMFTQPGLVSLILVVLPAGDTVAKQCWSLRFDGQRQSPGLGSPEQLWTRSRARAENGCGTFIIDITSVCQITTNYWCHYWFHLICLQTDLSIVIGLLTQNVLFTHTVLLMLVNTHTLKTPISILTTLNFNIWSKPNHHQMFHWLTQHWSIWYSHSDLIVNHEMDSLFMVWRCHALAASGGIMKLAVFTVE